MSPNNSAVTDTESTGIFDQRGQQVYGSQTNIAGSVTFQQPPPLRIPLQRPARAEHFVDRQEALNELRRVLQPGQVVTLCGPGGIGKTALAAELIGQLVPDDTPPVHFPDGILTHSFYGHGQIDLACEQIARTFGEELKPDPRSAARRALAGRQALLFLDGTEEADDLSTLLALCDRCGILITSRRREDALAVRYDIEPLPAADAITLLQAWGGERASDTVTVSAIAELVGRLPLALRLVGRYLAAYEENAADYLKWLQETPLAALDQGQRREQSVPLLLERSLAQIGEIAKSVLGVIGLLALAPFAATMIATALDLSDRTTHHALGELVNYGLLLRPNETYNVSHALIHTYSRERLATPDEVIKRLATYFMSVINMYATDFPLLNTLRPHVVAMIRLCQARSVWDLVYGLTRAMKDYLDLQGHGTDRITVLKAALTAARATKDLQTESMWLGNLGLAYSALGQMETAINHHLQALTINQETGDRLGEAACLNNLGIAYRHLGKVETAINYHQQALTIHKEINYRVGEGADLGNLGLAYAALGQCEIAIDYHQHALVINQVIGNRRAEGNNLNNLGLVYANLGQVKTAISYYDQALRIACDIGDRRSEGARLGNLGNAYSDLGQVEIAIKYYQQALAIVRDIGDRRGMGINLGNLGVAYNDLGEVEKAITYYHEAILIHHDIGDRRSESAWQCNLGRALAIQGDLQSAMQYGQRALAIKREILDRPGEGEALNHLGYVYYQYRDLLRSLDLHQQAIAIFREMHYRALLVQALLDLGTTCFALDHLEQARSHWQEALTIALEIGNRRTEGEALAHLGRVAQATGQFTTAHQHWSTAVAILEGIKAPTAAHVREWLAQEQRCV